MSQVSLGFLEIEVPQVLLGMDRKDHLEKKVCRVFQEDQELLVYQVLKGNQG